MITITGVLNYLAFGNNGVKMLATETLPSDSVFAQLMLLMYVLVAMFTFPLMIYPCIGILENWIIEFIWPYHRKHETYWARNFLRTVVCLIIACCSIYAAEFLDSLMALIGGLFAAPLALTLPAICHLVHLSKGDSKAICSNIAIIVVSLILMVFTSSTAISNIFL